MPRLEIPDIEDLSPESSLRRFLTNDFTGEFVAVLVLLSLLTVLTVVFDDPLAPMHSFGFVFGTAGVFFMAITYGTPLGLFMSAGIVTLMFWVSQGHEESARLSIFFGELPFLMLFFFGLSVIPNLMPRLLDLEAQKLRETAVHCEGQVSELQKALDEYQKEARAQHSDRDRSEAVKYSTRIIVLHTFCREILQSSSMREILNIFFHNLTRVFGVQECAMLVTHRSSSEMVITRIVHPDQETLENRRLSRDLPLLRLVFERHDELLLPSAAPLEDSLEARYLLPIIVGGEIYAIFVLNKTKSGPLQEDQAQFIRTMGHIAQGAIQQIQEVLQGS